MLNKNQVAKFFNVTKQTANKWLKDFNNSGLKHTHLNINHFINRDNKYIKYIIPYCKAIDLEAPFFEYKFSKKRQFLADLCWIDKKIILEIEGGVFGHSKNFKGGKNNSKVGYHQSPKRYLSDIEKYNMAQDLGYKVYRCIPQNLYNELLKIKERINNDSK